MANEELSDADVGIGPELSDADIGIAPRDIAAEKKSLADEMSKLRRERFWGEQEQAALGAAEDIASVASIPARPILKLPRSEGTGAGAGALNVGAGLAEGLSAPAYWMLPASKPLKALVSGELLGRLPQTIRDTINTFRNPSATTAQKVEAGAAPVIQGVAGAAIGGAKLPARESFPKVPDPREVAREATLPPKEPVSTEVPPVIEKPKETTTPPEQPVTTPVPGESVSGAASGLSLNRQVGELPKGTKVELTGNKSQDPLNAWTEVKTPDGNIIRVAPSWLTSGGKKQTLPQLIKSLGRDEVERLIGEWDQNAELSEDGSFIRTLADPRNQTGKTKASVKDFMSWVSSEANKPQSEPTTLGQGPGAATVGDVPIPAPQAEASVAPIERPFGPVSSISVGLNNALNALKNIGTTLKGIAGESMPKTTNANREVGEAGVRYASSRIAAKPQAQLFASKVLSGTNVDPIEFGAALTEDNLRSIRESFRQKASEARAEGKGDLEKFNTEQADKVSTIIGSKGSPFETEEQYFDYLNRPEVQQAIKQHVQMWQEVIDPQYKQAMDIDPDTPLPSRGQQTGARVNLRAVQQEEPAAHPIRGLVGSNLTGTFKKKSPFGIRAKGTGAVYDVNYNNLIQNTFERQLETANKNRFDNMLVASGNAVIDKPGQTVMIGGKPAVGFPLSRKVLITKSKGETDTIPRAMNIYVRQDLANEYEGAAGVGTKWRNNPITKAMTVINKAALTGLTDATVHVSNQMTALFNRPVSGKLLYDSLLSATGRADVPVTIFRAISKAFQDNTEQIAQLSEIGAMRPQDIHSGLFGRTLQKTDRITRLVLDDTFQNLVKEGLVENTETARREYVNQIGQYNRRLQGKVTRLFRDTGLGPFVTAGKTFNSLGVKMATLDPGAKASNNFAAAALRANVASKWIGGFVLLGTLNYLLTRNLKGGGMLGRPGTPLGNLDLGTNDKTGKQQSVPLFSILGIGRGLRVTGLSGAINTKRLGLTNADAASAATRDLINSWSAPFAGPPIKFGAISTTGYSPAVNVGRSSHVVPPGENQFLENVKEALIESSPISQSIQKYREGKPTSEVIAGQIPRFTMVPGKTPEMIEKYPKIVSMAQGNAFIDDMIHQARRLPKEERRKFVMEQVMRLPPEQRAHGRTEAIRRKVYTK